MKQSRKEPQPRMLFLFSDYLLYAHIILDSSKCRVTERLRLDGEMMMMMESIKRVTVELISGLTSDNSH